MEPTTTRSNQGIYYTLLILHSLVIVYYIGTRIYYSYTSSYISFNFWDLINLAISISFIVLIAMKRFGILLFLITSLTMATFTFIGNTNSFRFLTGLNIIIELVKLVTLVLMVILLWKEKTRYFNLNFGLVEVGYKKTYRLILAFNITFLIIAGVIIAWFLSETYNPGVTIFLNEYTIIYLIVLLLTIIGIALKSKILNLAFAVALSGLYLVFRQNGTFIQAPFMEDWQGWGMIAVLFGLILDGIFLIFGVFLYFVIRTYFKEKVELKNQSDLDLLEIN